MRNWLQVWGSSAGIKLLVAGSGLLLWAWIALHALGLIGVFGGAARIDGYSAMLHAHVALLWAMRAGLLLLALVHVSGTLAIARRAHAARGARGAAVRYRAASLASRAMRAGGVLLFVFVVLHVLHMTAGVLHPAFAPGHVYENLARGLRPPLVACGYVAAALVIGLHVLHGLWSAPRSIGLREAAAGRLARPLVAAVALALVLGFAAVPIAVLTGVVR
jgi:succinate dehydrogenase / fumarate reductase cytochrome b subunit